MSLFGICIAGVQLLEKASQKEYPEIICIAQGIYCIQRVNFLILWMKR